LSSSASWTASRVVEGQLHGQPDIAEPEPFGKAHLLDLLVDAIGVLFRRRRQ